MNAKDRNAMNQRIIRGFSSFRKKHKADEEEYVCIEFPVNSKGKEMDHLLDTMYYHAFRACGINIVKPTKSKYDNGDIIDTEAKEIVPKEKRLEFKEK